MSVRLRQWKTKEGKVQEAWWVDVKYQHPSGRVERIRKASPINTRRGAEEYERQIRLEHRHVPQSLYQSVRKKDLRDWLLRPQIYWTEWFRSRYEAAARSNIQRALRRMTGAPLMGGG